MCIRDRSWTDRTDDRQRPSVIGGAGHGPELFDRVRLRVRECREDRRPLDLHRDDGSGVGRQGSSAIGELDGYVREIGTVGAQVCTIGSESETDVVLARAQTADADILPISNGDRRELPWAILGLEPCDEGFVHAYLRTADRDSVALEYDLLRIAVHIDHDRESGGHVPAPAADDIVPGPTADEHLTVVVLRTMNRDVRLASQPPDRLSPERDGAPVPEDVDGSGLGEKPRKGRARPLRRIGVIRVDRSPETRLADIVPGCLLYTSDAADE